MGKWVLGGVVDDLESWVSNVGVQLGERGRRRGVTGFGRWVGLTISGQTSPKFRSRKIDLYRVTGAVVSKTQSTCEVVTSQAMKLSLSTVRGCPPTWRE